MGTGAEGERCSRCPEEEVEEVPLEPLVPGDETPPACSDERLTGELLPTIPRPLLLMLMLLLGPTAAADVEGEEAGAALVPCRLLLRRVNTVAAGTTEVAGALAAEVLAAAAAAAAAAAPRTATAPLPTATPRLLLLLLLLVTLELE
jgi:hypothetical protein